jgi:hypothetical protein
MKPPQAELTDPWRDYVRRTRHFGLALAAMPECIGFAFWWLDARKAPVLAAAVFALWLVPFVIATWRLQFFPCPDCGKPFGYKYLNNLPIFEAKCMHCGLPKWEH